MKMEQTEFSGTSENKIQTSGKRPKERIQNYLHEFTFLASWFNGWDLGFLVGSVINKVHSYAKGAIKHND